MPTAAIAASSTGRWLRPSIPFSAATMISAQIAPPIRPPTWPPTLIRGEAKHTAGQALSRLLNLTDGLLGQGRNVLVGVTTNEDGDISSRAVTDWYVKQYEMLNRLKAA